MPTLASSIALFELVDHCIDIDRVARAVRPHREDPPISQSANLEGGLRDKAIQSLGSSGLSC